MALSDRAAQFSPFAALTGHEDSIRETARRTQAFLELDENKKEQLDEKMHVLQEYSIVELHLDYKCTSYFY